MRVSKKPIKLEVLLENNSVDEILKAFEVLEKASSEFELYKEEYLDEVGVMAIRRHLHNEGFHLFKFEHFHLNKKDINFTLKIKNFNGKD